MKEKICVFIILCFVLIPTFVYASPIDEDCVNDHTCMVLCNYKTTYTASGGYATGYQSQTRYRNLTIYYSYENGAFVTWQGFETDATIRTKGPGTFNDILNSNKSHNSYWLLNYSPTTSNFVCPNYGYIDSSSLNGSNEICFDDDGSSCRDYKSNVGTAFGKNGGFQSVEKDYDFEEQISFYLENVFEFIADDVSNGKFDLNTQWAEKLKTDFITNFMSNNAIPEFILNSEAFKEIENDDNVLAHLSAVKEKTLNQAYKDYLEGNKTWEEYQAIVDNWNYDEEKVSSQNQEGTTFIRGYGIYNPNFNFEEGDSACDSLLGKVTDNNDPAYYINFAFNLIKYIAIILLIALSVMDIVKAIVASDNDALKKAGQKLVKRLIICVIIFFLPTLINFILKTIGWVTDPMCGIGGVN